MFEFEDSIYTKKQDWWWIIADSFSEDFWADARIKMPRIHAKKDSQWMWKDEKDEYEVFVKSFWALDKAEDLIHDRILHDNDIFITDFFFRCEFLTFEFMKEGVFDVFQWFEDVYDLLTQKKFVFDFKTFFKVMNFRIDSSSKLLWEASWEFLLDVYFER